MRLLTLYLGFAALAAACGNDPQNGEVTAAAGAGAGGTNGGAGNGVSGGKSEGGSALDVPGGGAGAVGSMSGSGGDDAHQPEAAGAGGSHDLGGDAGAASDAGGGHLNAGAGGAGVSGSAGSGGASGTGGATGNCGVVTADRRIFVSSAVYSGALGGLSGADAKCQTLASAAALCGTFKAWLSDGTADAAARLTHATGNYVLANGQVVASGWAGLTSGSIQHAIDLTEMKGLAPVGTLKCAGSPIVPVWTGATISGVAVANGSCNNWATASTGPGAVFGSASALNSAWNGMCQLTTVCADTAALYCVEQ